ncbi:MAG TPA: hypothetical protein P5099_03635 [Candidatus Moranbacteria bacterium]|nr:hypothetical protein [Candidatus Moranbacteria bacterium]
MFGEWLIYAVASIVCWGLVNVLDSYFIENKTYENIWDGTIVSSLYKIIGVVILGGIFFTKVVEISLAGALLSMLGGALISAAFLFCFAAILYHNDMSLIQVVWNLSSPVVVVMGWFFLGEKFAPLAYVGMIVVFAGSFIVSFQKDSFKCNLGKLLLFLIPMVILYSASEVLMKYVEIQKIDFEQSFPFVCLGQVLFGSIILIFRQNPKHVGRIVKENWHLFFSSEALELIGLFLMQLAIAKTPSIALFGVVESFMPVMVVVLTGVCIFLLKIFKRGKTLERVYEENMLAGLPAKVIATAVMMAGIYLIG